MRGLSRSPALSLSSWSRGPHWEGESRPPARAATIRLCRRTSFLQSHSHMSHVTRPMSHATRHKSHVKRHTSHFPYHTSKVTQSHSLKSHHNKSSHLDSSKLELNLGSSLACFFKATTISCRTIFLILLLTQLRLIFSQF